MDRKWIPAALLLAAMWSVDVCPASAQYACLGAYYPYRPYAADIVPYFISHPPIYYSYSLLKPVDPWRWQREAVVEQPVVEPVLIVNPYVVGQATGVAQVSSDGVVPLRIKNPYVAQR
jgi:hypothetical protein